MRRRESTTARPNATPFIRPIHCSVLVDTVNPRSADNTGEGFGVRTSVKKASELSGGITKVVTAAATPPMRAIIVQIMPSKEIADVRYAAIEQNPKTAWAPAMPKASLPFQ